MKKIVNSVNKFFILVALKFHTLENAVGDEGVLSFSALALSPTFNV